MGALNLWHVAVVAAVLAGGVMGAIGLWALAWRLSNRPARRR